MPGFPGFRFLSRTQLNALLVSLLVINCIAIIGMLFVANLGAPLAPAPYLWLFGCIAVLSAGVALFYVLVLNRQTAVIQRKLDEQTEALREHAAALAEILKAHDGLIRHIPMGVFRLRMPLDGRMDFDYVSPLWCRQFNLPEQATAAIHADLALNRIWPDDRASLLVALEQGRTMLQPLVWEGRCGSTTEARWLQIRATPTPLENGDLVWEGVQSDITESKAIEERQRLLSSAIAQSHASIVITDAAGDIVFVNEAFRKTTGYDFTEVSGRNPRILQSGLTPLETYQELWRTIRDGKTWRGELQNRKKCGELYWELATISPVMDAQGQISHYIAVKDNITERKSQEIEIRLAKEEAEAANLAKSQFLATMSHEIRTPMNGILGMAQLLLMGDLKPEEHDDYIRTILNSGNALQSLLNDILDLSRIEAGKLELHPNVFYPRQILEETAALFGGPARQKGLQIEAAWHGPADRRYSADAIRIRQMLSNLISNAVKFTDHGYIRIDGAEISVDTTGALLSFTVTDTGIGIPQEKLDKLFKVFSQLDGSHVRRHGGSGLGLSIVQRIASLMDGTVGVDSIDGQGSRFWFRVRAGIASPLDEARDMPRAGSFCFTPPQASHEPVTPAIASPNQPLVLVVEDNMTNRKVAMALLGKLGLRTASAENGQLALDAMSDGLKPDLILMDIQMPVLDGYATTQAIRAHEQQSAAVRLPIVALTADAFEQDRQRCLDAGMDDFLPKPLVLKDLQKAMEKWLSPR